MMSREEVKTILEANQGKRVRITYSDGEVWLVDVSSVDDEGFVHSGPDGDQHIGFWTRLEYVSDVSI